MSVVNHRKPNVWALVDKSLNLNRRSDLCRLKLSLKSAWNPSRPIDTLQKHCRGLKGEAIHGHLPHLKVLSSMAPVVCISMAMGHPCKAF